LDSSIPSVAEADETTVTFRQAVLENELSQDIQLLLSTQSEFACPRMIVAPNMATGFQPWIVGPMLLRQARSRKSPEAAVAWLEKVLSTERAEGIEIETFWGFTPTAKEVFCGDIQLLAFSSLPPSRQKEALSEPPLGSISRLSTPPFAWKEPCAAFARPVTIQPLLVDTNVNLQLEETQLFSALVADARLCLSASGPAAIVPGPGWFQFTDPDLELARLGAGAHFTHQEITPLTLGNAGQVNSVHASDLFCRFLALDSSYQNRVRTAMQRLGLACLRRAPADSALELAIALEALLVDTPGEHTFKLAFRAAILTGTDLESRRRTRSIIEAMYKMRSSLMHSGQCSETVKVRGFANARSTEVIAEASRITAMVIHRMIDEGNPPDWNTLELSITI
jgi:hypothetical protein